MSTRLRYEVIPIDDGVFRWKFKAAGSDLGRFHLKQEAVHFAARYCRIRWEELRQRSTLKIKGRNGRIQDERTYGDDPVRYKG